MAACEAIIRKQYSLLGWEYTDTLSEGEGDKVTNCGNVPVFSMYSLHIGVFWHFHNAEWLVLVTVVFKAIFNQCLLNF